MLDEERKLLEAQRADQQKALRLTQARLEAIARAEADAKLEPLKGLAKRAHDLLCPYNHTDGCSWRYEEGSPGDLMRKSECLALIAAANEAAASSVVAACPTGIDAVDAIEIYHDIAATLRALTTADQQAALDRMIQAARDVRGWQPPDDREDGYRCLGWTDDGWVGVTWLHMALDPPQWFTDWYPEREDKPTAFAPLPAALADGEPT